MSGHIQKCISIGGAKYTSSMLGTFPVLTREGSAIGDTLAYDTLEFTLINPDPIPQAGAFVAFSSGGEWIEGFDLISVQRNGNIFKCVAASKIHRAEYKQYTNEKDVANKQKGHYFEGSIQNALNTVLGDEEPQNNLARFCDFSDAGSAQVQGVLTFQSKRDTVRDICFAHGIRAYETVKTIDGKKVCKTAFEPIPANPKILQFPADVVKVDYTKENKPTISGLSLKKYRYQEVYPPEKYDIISVEESGGQDVNHYYTQDAVETTVTAQYGIGSALTADSPLITQVNGQQIADRVFEQYSQTGHLSFTALRPFSEIKNIRCGDKAHVVLRNQEVEGVIVKMTTVFGNTLDATEIELAGYETVAGIADDGSYIGYTGFVTLTIRYKDENDSVFKTEALRVYNGDTVTKTLDPVLTVGGSNNKAVYLIDPEQPKDLEEIVEADKTVDVKYLKAVEQTGGTLFVLRVDEAVMAEAGIVEISQSVLATHSSADAEDEIIEGVHEYEQELTA